MGIVMFLCCVAGVFVPEALVIIDGADRRIRLIQCASGKDA
jgi:hypothetical protein